MSIKLGTKRGECAISKPPKDKLYYPSMYIDETKLPLDAKDVGKTFDANIKLKVTGVSQNTSTINTRFNYNFEIHEIEFVEKKGKK